MADATISCDKPPVTIKKARIIWLYVIVSLMAMLVSGLAGFLVAVLDDISFIICHEGTPYLGELGIIFGAVLGLCAAILWTGRVVRRAYDATLDILYKDVTYALLLAFAATVMLHLEIRVAQSLIRNEPLRWEELVTMIVMFGLICSLLAGAIVGFLAALVAKSLLKPQE